MKSSSKGISLILCILALAAFMAGCATFGVSVPGTRGAVGVTASKRGIGVAGVYNVGGFTFRVAKAPIRWPLMNPDIQEIGGLPPKEAIRKGRVKNAPYTVKGRRYYPMSVSAARQYSETGTASWYGYETLVKKGGHMTANGEVFDPEELTAAHKLLPLPTYVRVTNLENGRSIVVRVNDRGPFPSASNPRSGDRIIDLSVGAAKKLGFYSTGTARVRVETVQVG